MAGVERVLLVIVSVALLAFIIWVIVKKSYCDAPAEKFDASEPTIVTPYAGDADVILAKAPVGGPGPGAVGAGPDGLAGPAVASTTGPVPACYPRDRLTAEDLLPKDAANSKWAQANPAGQGDVSDANFLTAGYAYGINTQGSSLRNANLQLRSDPPNPQIPVSPWYQSTITPDLNRLPLEIGGAL